MGKSVRRMLHKQTNKQTGLDITYVTNQEIT
jgi:hypothetical protein